MQRRKYALLKQPFELDALGDVSLSNPVLGDVVYYDGSFWINTPYAELVDDRVASLLVAGNNIDLTYDDTLGTITIDVETLTSADISDFNEAVDDRVGSLIVAGNNIDVTYNDGTNTFTIDVEGLTSADISDFTEAAQDAVGAMAANGTGVTLTYNDATPSLTPALDINGLTAEASVDAAADYFVMYDASAGAHRKVLGSDMPGGGGGGGGGTVLTPDVDEDLLSSIANWTQVAGTWSAGGSYTEVTPGSTTAARLKYNNKVPHADMTVEVEFYHRSDAPVYADDDSGLGIKMGWDGAGTGDIYVGVTFSNNTPLDIRVENEFVTLLKTWSPGALATDTWHKLKVITNGGWLSVYLDSTLIGNYATSVYDATSPDYVGLRAYQGNPRFRNFKVWYGGNVGFAVGDNVTHVDAPPVTPDSADDEFEGDTLDSKWTWRNQGSATAVPSGGCLVLTAPASSGNNMRIIEQSVSGNWKYRAKISAQLFANYSCAGISVMRTASGKIVRLNKVHDTGTGTESFSVNRMDGVATFNTTFFADDIIDKYGAHQQFLYMEIEHDGTNIVFRISGNGVDFTQYYAETTAAFLGGAPDKIQLFAESNNSSSKDAVLVCDWFRKIGSGYAPGKFAVNAQLEPSTVNVTPDTHPTAPNAMDDEFEGTSLDSKWTWRNQGSATATLSSGSLVLTTPAASGNNMRCIEQTVSGSFKVRAKISAHLFGDFACAGLYVAVNSSGKILRFNKVHDSGTGTEALSVNRMTDVSTFSSTTASSDSVDRYGSHQQFAYMEIEYDGTTVYFRISGDGVVMDGYTSETSASFLGAAPDRVGLFVEANNASFVPSLVCDWFRRIS